MNEQTLPGVVAQVRAAAYRKNRLAAFCGAVMGAFVPVASYEVAHYEATHSPWLWCLVLAALVFSSISVYSFGKAAFRNRAKAFAYAALVEGVMVLSGSWWLSCAALLLLVAVNGIETGTNLALDDSNVYRERVKVKRTPVKHRDQRDLWPGERESSADRQAR